MSLSLSLSQSQYYVNPFEINTAISCSTLWIMIMLWAIADDLRACQVYPTVFSLTLSLIWYRMSIHLVWRSEKAAGTRQEAIQSSETAISCQTDLNIAHATSQQHQSRAQRDVEWVSEWARGRQRHDMGKPKLMKSC